MNDSAYIFSKHETLSEKERLQVIESVFDPSTQALLHSVINPSKKKLNQCLEIGAGAGSIARYLTQISEQVDAIDLKTDYLDPQAGYTVIQGDFLNEIAPQQQYDLIHLRYVLIHQKHKTKFIDHLYQCIAPGGFLVLEEPDFVSARAIDGTLDEKQAMEKVHQSIHQLFKSRGMDDSDLLNLPRYLTESGFQLKTSNLDPHYSPGQSGVAEVMRLSTIALAEAYLATKLCDLEDLKVYERIASDPKAWTLWYSTLRIVATK